MNQVQIEKFRLLAQEQFSRGLERHHIEAELTGQGAEAHVIRVILDEIRTLELIRRKRRGFRLVLAGSFLLVFGFLITLLLFHSSTSISYAMYGLTTAGVICLLWGMVDIMGW